MKQNFQLFRSHLDLAHNIWNEQLNKIKNTKTRALDCTMGNGHDTKYLLEQLLEHAEKKLVAIDIQQNALTKTQELLGTVPTWVRLVLGDHSKLNELFKDQSFDLIVYNLGYLPGGDKNFTTQKNSTLQSLDQACDLLNEGGLISITCYPGHEEGEKEEKALLEWSSELDSKIWNSTHHRFLNRKASPSLITLQKSL